jgi:multidrug efflux pump subunit AcrA (membrane-fusion protein)
VTINARFWLLFLIAAGFGTLVKSGVAGDEKSVEGIRLAGCRVKPADQVTLAVNESGILDLIAREGDRVDVGQEIARLQDDLPRAALAIAEKESGNDVEIRFSEISSDVALLEHEQALKVNASVKGSVTVIDIRRRKLELDQSRLRIELAKYNQEVAALKRDQAAVQLKSFRIVAPFNGTVNKVLKHKGESARQGDPVLELINTRQIRVEGYIDVTQRRNVSTGAKVRVEPETQPDGTAEVAALHGKIIFVDSVVQPVTRQVRVCAEVENPDEAMLPGQTAIMKILTERNLPVITGR